jgi:hypothetical protein
MPGSLAPIKTLTQKLSVNSEFQPARECEKRDAAGVRNIEVQLPATRAISQSRLARRIITEKKLFRFDIHLAAADSPEHPAGNDKSLTVSLKVKAVYSLLFITRKERCAHLRDVSSIQLIRRTGPLPVGSFELKSIRLIDQELSNLLDSPQPYIIEMYLTS